MQVWNVLHAARWKYRTQKSPKIAIWAPSHNFVGLYLRNWGTYRQTEKNLLSSNMFSRCPPQYGELRPSNGWVRFVTLGHPQISTGFASWQRYWAACSSGRQPNFTALIRGHHLCSAGRPSRWALTHISSLLMVSVGNLSTPVWHLLFLESRSTWHRNLLMLQQRLPAICHIVGEVFVS